VSKWYTQISWDEVPHLSEKDKADQLARTLPYQREARSRGIPSVGSGLIYPIEESAIVVQDFPIEDYYRRAWALDIGWNCTACVWGAQNPDTGVTYLYACYKRGQAEPETHAKAIKGFGSWIPGVGDAADTNKLDGRQMITIYRDEHGLDLVLPNKAVHAGIYKVWIALNDGKLKIFRSLLPVLEEMRFYARNEKGEIVKKDDHLMDAMRYLVMSGMDRAIPAPAKTEPTEDLDHLRRFVTADSVSGGWMAS
jgi:hypothetical protein